MSGPLYEDFDFDKWIEQNELQKIREVFEEHEMDESEQLVLTNPKMGLFLADKRVSPYLTKLFKALQNINEFITNKIKNENNNNDDIKTNNISSKIQNGKDTNNISTKGNQLPYNNYTPTTLIISNEENAVMKDFKSSLKKIINIDKQINELKKEYKLSKNKQEINYKIKIDKSKQNVKKLFKNIKVLINEKEHEYINKLNKLYSEQSYDDFKEISLTFTNLKKAQKNSIENNIKQCNEMFKTKQQNKLRKRKHSEGDDLDDDILLGNNDDDSIESSISIDNDDLLFDFDNEDRKSKISDIGNKQQTNFEIQYKKMIECRKKLNILVTRYKTVRDCEFIINETLMSDLTQCFIKNCKIKNDGQYFRYQTEWSKEYKGKDILLSENNRKAYLNGNYQSIRAINHLPKGEVSIWEYTVWITTRSCYFFGVISSNNENKNIFNKTVDQQVFLDTYGIDDKENYIYVGSKNRRKKCEWFKPKIPTKKENTIKIIADYKDKKQLKLTYYFNNKKMSPKDKKYTFILPTIKRNKNENDIDDDGESTYDVKWYPSVSLYNQKAWCRLSFPVQTEVLD